MTMFQKGTMLGNTVVHISGSDARLEKYNKWHCTVSRDSQWLGKTSNYRAATTVAQSGNEWQFATCNRSKCPRDWVLTEQPAVVSVATGNTAGRLADSTGTNPGEWASWQNWLLGFSHFYPSLDTELTNIGQRRLTAHGCGLQKCC